MQDYFRNLFAGRGMGVPEKKKPGADAGSV
jgi:hypothetical protein